MRFILAYILYFIGDMFFHLSEFGGNMYQKFMVWSSDIQGPGSNGPWNDC